KYRIKIIKQENKGLTASLNTAMGLAKGKYIARMDADDISLPSRFKDSRKFLEDNNLDFISTQAERFIGNIEYNKVPRKRRDSTDINLKSLKYGNPFVHGTYFFKREIFDYMQYNEVYRTAQDYDFIVRLCKSGRYKVGYLNKSLYRLRIDENSSGRSINSSQLYNARKIAIEHFGTDRLLIPKYNGFRRLAISIWKRLAYEW
ncbi:glycosyltransferase, partial [Vibrio breoganii]